jgi:DNA-binding response OmpR family regulator
MIKLLLIEDDPLIISLYKEGLEKRRFEIQVAEDGEKGLEMAKTQKPEVILLDLMLPKLDGFSLLKELKSLPNTKDIPVFVVTSFGMDDNVRRAYELGAYDVILKYQVSPIDIALKIRKFLKR